jgi:hypothetical protein
MCLNLPCSENFLLEEQIFFFYQCDVSAFLSHSGENSSPRSRSRSPCVKVGIKNLNYQILEKLMAGGGVYAWTTIPSVNLRGNKESFNGKPQIFYFLKPFILPQA